MSTTDIERDAQALQEGLQRTRSLLYRGSDASALLGALRFAQGAGKRLVAVASAGRIHAFRGAGAIPDGVVVPASKREALIALEIDSCLVTLEAFSAYQQRTNLDQVVYRGRPAGEGEIFLHLDVNTLRDPFSLRSRAARHYARDAMRTVLCNTSPKYKDPRELFTLARMLRRTELNVHNYTRQNGITAIMYNRPSLLGFSAVGLVESEKTLQPWAPPGMSAPDVS